MQKTPKNTLHFSSKLLLLQFKHFCTLPPYWISDVVVAGRSRDALIDRWADKKSTVIITSLTQSAQFMMHYCKCS